MAFTLWPDTIPEPQGISEGNSALTLTSTSSAGYTMSRRRNTVSKKTFKLSWSAIHESHKSTLTSFFNENKGSIITWHHADLDEDFDCIILEDELEFTFVVGLPKYWQGGLTLKEA